ncbi:MAG: carboxylate-amine ligase, partial [Spirulinaceae cyanobacterium]
MPHTPEPNATEQFYALQGQLRDYAQTIDLFDQDDFDVLVIPSLSLDQDQLSKIPGFCHYEERLLFSLIRLRNPLTRLIYVTAQPIAPLIVDYYLQFLAGIPFSHARDRLLLFSVQDTSLKSLSQKLLERPRLLERIRQALRPNRSYMVCYNSTPLEQALSLRLGIPLLACPPDLLHWGSKSGSREIFAQTQIQHPDGSKRVWNEADLCAAIAQLWQRNPDLKQVVIKLNDGFSGEGNALLDLRSLGQLAPDARHAALPKALKTLRPQGEGMSADAFLQRIPDLGVLAEVFVEGEEKRSPSFQGYIMPNGEVKILSTHDQILGGPDGQIYLGCRFPADAAYRLAIQAAGVKVGQ